MLNSNINQIIQEGDIIFSSIPNMLYKAVEKGTNSKTSHVGIVLKVNEQWMVAESKVPYSKLSTIEDFISRSDKGWLSIKRTKTPLTKQQVSHLKTSCYKRFGTLYDFGFNYDSKRIFCSKFVYDVFLEACNIEVGQIETFCSLLQKTNNDITFWKIWFCGFIPFQAKTVTPHSQWVDPNLIEIYTHTS